MDTITGFKDSCNNSPKPDRGFRGGVGRDIIGVMVVDDLLQR